MTRINCIPVEELSNAHLIAEYRELPRVLTLIRNRIKSKKPITDKTTPIVYTMGPGHVKFFYTKWRWLASRYIEIIKELKHREFNPTFSGICVADIDNTYRGSGLGGWSPTHDAMYENRQRIIQRVTENPSAHKWTEQDIPLYLKHLYY